MVFLIYHLLCVLEDGGGGGGRRGVTGIRQNEEK